MNTLEKDKSLFQAIKEGDLKKVNEALYSGANINSLSKNFNRKPIFNACGFNHVDIIKVLLNRGAFATDGLMPAAMSGNIKLLQLLIENKADVNAKLTENGHTLLHIACDFNQVEFIRYLLTIDTIELSPETNEGKTPYDLLKKFGMDDDLKSFLKK
ncbi:MAG: ankyrin repeat domain-containing protein [Bacteroidales bacterium]|nr:ankyrin repeat domain-containing protein [Bacteroidales bacterium]